jgi:hypothetical protein
MMDKVKTLAEKIAVMQACLDGKTVLVRSTVYKDSEWENIGTPNFNWEVHDYCVADKKKIKMLCFFDGASLSWIKDGHPHLTVMKRVPAEDKEIEIEDI